VTAREFTLLLPVYAGNSVAQLVEAFESSVDRQSLPPSAVVIVVDGPVPTELDHALDRLAEASPVPVSMIRLPRNAGLAMALNEGLEASRTELVARMDADDVSAPDRFERQIPVIADRGLDILGSGLAEFDGDVANVVATRVPPIGAEEIRRVATFRQPFHHPSVVYRRSAVLGVGGYPTDVGRFEDYVLFARMLVAGASVDNLREPLLFYRLDGGAYARRGGWDQFKAELRLQRELRRAGLTSRAQWFRNSLVRAAYRLVPTGIRMAAYRRVMTPS